MSVFGVDLIIEQHSERLFLIDVNYLSAEKGLPNVALRLIRCLFAPNNNKNTINNVRFRLQIN